MRSSSIGLLFGGGAATVGAILMLKADSLATNWPGGVTGSWSGCGLCSLALGLCIGFLGFTCWLWEDKF
jgi:hypothetical protein